MNQIIGGRTMIAVQRRMEDTCGTAGIEAEAAVAAMEQVADRAEELPPGETTKCLRGEANAEVAFLPNDDLSTVPNTNVGAFQGPPTRLTRSNPGGGSRKWRTRDRRDGRVT